MSKNIYEIEELANGKFSLYMIYKLLKPKRYWWNRQKYTISRINICENMTSKSDAEIAMRNDIKLRTPLKVLSTTRYTDKGRMRSDHYPI